MIASRSAESSVPIAKRPPFSRRWISRSILSGRSGVPAHVPGAHQRCHVTPPPWLSILGRETMPHAIDEDLLLRLATNRGRKRHRRQSLGRLLAFPELYRPA